MPNENTKKSSFLRMPFSSSSRLAKTIGLPKLMTNRLSSTNISPALNSSRSPMVRSAAVNKNPAVSPASLITATEVSGRQVTAAQSIETSQPTVINFEDLDVGNSDTDPNQIILVDLSSPAKEVSSLDLECPLPLSPSRSLEPLVLPLLTISSGGLDHLTEIDPRLIPLPLSPLLSQPIDSVGLVANDLIIVQPCLIPLPVSPTIEPEEDAALSDSTSDLSPLDSLPSPEELSSDSPLDQLDQISLASSIEDDPMPSTPQSPAQILGRPIPDFVEIKSPVKRPTVNMATATATKQTIRKRMSTHNFFNSRSSVSPNEPTSPDTPLYGSFPSFFGRSPFGKKPAGLTAVSVASSTGADTRNSSAVIGFQPAVSTSAPTTIDRHSLTSVLASADPNRFKTPSSDRVALNTQEAKPNRSSSSEPHHRRQKPQAQVHLSQPQPNGMRKTSTGPFPLPLLPHPSAFTNSHSCWNSNSPPSPIGSTGHGSTFTSAFGFDDRAITLNQKRKNRDISAGKSEAEKTLQIRRASKMFIPSENSRADWINMLEEKERSRDRLASKRNLGMREDNDQYERAELCFMI